MNCHNCGMPEGTLTNKGQHVQITLRAENNFCRDRKSTVWVCTEECAVQAWAISGYGTASSKWSVSLNQARANYKRERKQCP